MSFHARAELADPFPVPYTVALFFWKWRAGRRVLKPGMHAAHLCIV